MFDPFALLITFFTYQKLYPDSVSTLMTLFYQGYWSFIILLFKVVEDWRLSHLWMV